MEAADEADGLLLLGGEAPERRHLESILSRSPLVVAADSGFDLALRLGITPDLLIGDLDSVRPGPQLDRFPRERLLRYPRDKDQTDAELGLNLMRERGCRHVVLAGGGGGRLDHLLALVDLFERQPPPEAWLTAREEVRAVEGRRILSGCRGLRVSFFPLGCGVSGLSSSGLKWPLDGLRWSRGQEGVSNLILEDRASVGVARGRLLMILELKR